MNMISQIARPSDSSKEGSNLILSHHWSDSRKINSIIDHEQYKNNIDKHTDSRLMKMRSYRRPAEGPGRSWTEGG